MKLWHTGESEENDPPCDPECVQNGFVCDQVHLESCSNIQVGNKVMYNGNVTLHQFVHPGVYDNKVDLTDEHFEVIDKNDALYEEIVQELASEIQTEDQLEDAEGLHILCKTVLYAVAVSIGLLVSGIVVTLLIKTSIDESVFKNSDYPSDGKLLFVNRDGWYARKPLDAISKLTYPVKKVIIIHTATTFCFNKTECISIIHSVQNFHMDSNHFHDIAYNFLIGGNGMVFVGRGWQYRGAHTLRNNLGSIGIALIGTFTHEKPTKKQLSSVELLIELGVNLTKVSEDYVLFSHCQLRDTDSPGIFVHKIISNWTHYASGSNLLKCKI